MWLKKEAVGSESNLELLAKALKDSIVKFVREKTQDLEIPVEGTVEKKTIVQFNRRMRVDGLDKFVVPSFVSTVNYYLNEKEMALKKTIGALVVYIEEDYVATLLKLLKYPEIDRESDDARKDAAGTLANIIAGKFKNVLLNLGFQDLEMSPFSNYRQRSLQGIDFYHKELNKYEICVFIRGQKRLFVELTLGPIPRKVQTGG